jgi:hypothetical protein
MLNITSAASFTKKGKARPKNVIRTVAAALPKKPGSKDGDEMAKRDSKDLAIDDIWIIVTINKKSTRVRMLKPSPGHDRVKTIRHIAPNEYAYRLKITTNFKDWEDRIINHEMPAMKPPTRPKIEMSSFIGKSVEDKVTEKLTGTFDGVHVQ